IEGRHGELGRIGAIERDVALNLLDQPGVVADAQDPLFSRAGPFRAELARALLGHHLEEYRARSCQRLIVEAHGDDVPELEARGDDEILEPDLPRRADGPADPLRGRGIDRQQALAVVKLELSRAARDDVPG